MRQANELRALGASLAEREAALLEAEARAGYSNSDDGVVAAVASDDGVVAAVASDDGALAARASAAQKQNSDIYDNIGGKVPQYAEEENEAESLVVKELNTLSWNNSDSNRMLGGSQRHSYGGMQFEDSRGAASAPSTDTAATRAVPAADGDNDSNAVNELSSQSNPLSWYICTTPDTNEEYYYNGKKIFFFIALKM